MEAVLKYRSIDSSEICEVCAIGFKYVKFDGVEIVGGDKYFIDKAVSLGAIKKVVKNKKPKD